MPDPDTKAASDSAFQRARGALTAAMGRINPLVVVGVAYSVGFLVINLHMARLGIAHIDLIRSDYVLAGATWALLAWMAFLLPLAVLRVGLTIADRISYHPPKAVAVIVRIGLLVIAAWAALSVLTFLTEGALRIFSREGLKVAGVLLMNGLLAVNFASITLVETPDDSLSDESWVTDSYKWLVKTFLNAVVFLVAIFLYSYHVFPLLTPFLGGGRGQQVVVVFDTQGAAVAAAAGLEAPLEARAFSVDLLFEDSTGYVFRQRGVDGRRARAAAFRVAREFVDGVVYSEDSDRE